MDIDGESKLIKSIGGDGVLDMIAKHNKAQNTRKLAKALEINSIKKVNKEKRKNNDTWTDQRSMRQILEIPTEVAFALENIYGKRFWTDKKVLKKALEDDEFLAQYLTVPKNTI